MTQLNSVNATNRLKYLLEQINQQAKAIDQQNTHSTSHKLIENNNLFSEHLFHCRSDQFLHYVKEVEERINDFIRLNSSSTQSNNRSSLAITTLQQIEQQISALYNAIQANAAMHQAAQINFDAVKKVKIKYAKQKNENNKYHDVTSKVLSSSHLLYEKLNEHHEFERRLLNMITEREQQRSVAKQVNSEQLSKEVLALHQRLGRCRHAISIIERDIEFAEKR
ncbi:primosomal replication protein [Colwellia asteriadis]|uniref:Primosomal replication protein n=1 Tax=Colwellia asteriadis TaxID=517723 RepID=A0ABN1L6L3_9GAMM